MPTTRTPTPFPTDWPKDRYVATRRAMKALRLADRLLRRGLAYTPAEVTDEVIRTAAAQTRTRTPSATTCAQVRALLELLLPPTVTGTDTPAETSGSVPARATTSRPTT
ncbi:hypothetical protein [Streptomyces sp. NPDC005784]|uniref:hypothetical protein n=1 Tax=Streptomyces sp. NPDC005784 TaxID=3364731 RepID=UPI0036AEC8CE